MATFVVLRPVNNVLAGMGGGIETFINLKPETKLTGPNSIVDKGDFKGYLGQVTIDGVNYKDVQLSRNLFEGNAPFLRKLAVGGRKKTRKSRRKTHRNRRHSRRR